MPKLSKDQLVAVCDDLKYDGEQTPRAMKSWLDKQPVELDFDGKNYPPSACELEEDQAKRIISIPSTVKRKTSELADANGKVMNFDDDAIKSRVNAMVQEQLRLAGLQVVNGRPTLIDPAAGQITVKSSRQREWEWRKEARLTPFLSYENCELFKSWMAGTMARRADMPAAAEQHFKAYGELGEKVYGKAMSTISPTGGSALVPELFRPDLIKNVLDYGAFSQLTQVIDSSAPQILLPRRTGGLTVYWPSQNAAATQSNPTYDNVALSAQTAEILCTASMQMINDGAISVVDQVFQEMALSIAQIKDQCLLIGDGSATYGGMTGFERKYGLAAANTGQSVTGATTTDAHTQAQLAACIGRLPQYALRNAKWTTTPTLAAASFYRLSTSTAVTGLLYSDLTGKFIGTQFLGFPIVINNVMSSVTDASSTNRPGFTANSQIDILFGDFARASKMLNLIDVDLATSDQRGFDTYTMYFRAVARFHTVVHDVGTTTAAGPVVAFWQN